MTSILTIITEFPVEIDSFSILNSFKTVNKKVFNKEHK